MRQKTYEFQVPLLMTKNDTFHRVAFFPQHNVVGLLFWQPWRDWPQWLDFIISDPPEKTQVVVVVVVVSGPLFFSLGNYSHQIKNYEEFFDKSQILILLYDDLKSDTESLVNSVFSFLKVEKINIDLQIKNQMLTPSNALLSRLYKYKFSRKLSHLLFSYALHVLNGMRWRCRTVATAAAATVCSLVFQSWANARRATLEYRRCSTFIHLVGKLEIRKIELKYLFKNLLTFHFVRA